MELRTTIERTQPHPANIKAQVINLREAIPHPITPPTARTESRITRATNRRGVIPRQTTLQAAPTKTPVIRVINPRVAIPRGATPLPDPPPAARTENPADRVTNPHRAVLILNPAALLPVVVVVNHPGALTRENKLA